MHVAQAACAVAWRNQWTVLIALAVTDPAHKQKRVFAYPPKPEKLYKSIKGVHGSYSMHKMFAPKLSCINTLIRQITVEAVRLQLTAAKQIGRDVNRLCQC